nr:MAG: hypothetical protein [uncultured archaeon]
MTQYNAKKQSKKEPTSQYNAAFNMHYDVILRDLANYFFQNDIIESDSKYGLANYSILRTLFDYVDEVVEDYFYTPEHLVALIEEHDKLKTKFEAKLLTLVGKKGEKLEKVMLEIDVKSK